MAEEKAEFCLNTQVAPSEYDAMTVVETQAFVKVHNKMQRKK